jgi:hypothetical protein
MLGVPALSSIAYIVALFLNPKTAEKSEQNPTTRNQIEEQQIVKPNIND